MSRAHFTLHAAMDTDIEPWHHPHFSRGADFGLTEAHLDRAQRARVCATVSLSDLLLASGAVEGPFRRTKPLFRAHSRLPTLTKPREQLAEFFSTYALYRRGGNTRRYSARIAYGCAFLGCPF